jgi:erythromycin esterase-like protein
MTTPDGEAVRALARPLRDAADLDPLLDRIGDARVVAIGEASHGTHEYYAWRAALTRRLVAERGFSFVAVEGDWPDCDRVDRSVRLRPGGHDDPRDALDAFARWPTWMWANDDVVDFCRWLREHNAARPAGERVGFHGLDVYSLWDSMQEVVGWLRENEPEHVDQALAALRCFEPYGEDGAEYAFASRFAPSSCEEAVVELLHRLHAERPAPGQDPDDRFAAEQNVSVVVDAERYYRAMVQGSAESWNVRDVHMADTLDRLLAHSGGKAVVWEHNTHVGDARATDMADAGMVNVGQLLRERHGPEHVVLVGFGGHRGGVVAGAEWGAQMERMRVPAARAGSLEALLHAELGRDALVVVPAVEDRPGWLTRPLDHRAIGVVYRPERERWGNYVPTVLGDRYDAFLYLEETTPLQPLHLERADEHVPLAAAI